MITPENILNYKVILSDSTISLFVKEPATDTAPARLASRFISTEVTVDFVYDFLTDKFTFKIIESVNKNNTYLIDKMETDVREIAAHVLKTYSIDIVSIREAIEKAANTVVNDNIVLEEEITE